jgi:hypothetical protein
MGLKDLFGNKKKDELREKAKEVVAKDGKLAPGRVEALKALAEEHNADLADDKTKLRRDIYNEAVGTAKARGKLSEGEAAELAKIQKFLALRDDQVEKTKWDLARLRKVTEIRQGKLPTVEPSHVSLRGVQLNPGEVAHYSLHIDVQDRATVSGMPGVAVKWSTPYTPNAARAHSLPAEGAKDLGEGYLVLTSKRLILRSSGVKTAAVDYGPQANLFLYSDGLRIERTDREHHPQVQVKIRRDRRDRGELLAALMR